MKFENVKKNYIKKLKYEADKYLDSLQQFQHSIYTGKSNIDETEIDQSNLLENVVEFNNKSKPKAKERKTEKHAFKSVNALYEYRVLTLNAFRNETFPINAKRGTWRLHMLASHPLELARRLEVITPKEMLQGLPIALAPVKAGNTSEKLLN